MIEVKRAEVRTENGHQVIVLPEDIHIEGAEVYVAHDPSTGDLTLRRGRTVKQSAVEFLAFLASLDIPQEELDAWLTDRPLNAPLEPGAVLGNDE